MHNTFGGEYSVRKCNETCRLQYVMNTCGQVPLQYRHFVPDSWYSTNDENDVIFQRNQPFNASVCTKNDTQHSAKKIECESQCQIECDSENYRVTVFFGFVFYLFYFNFIIIAFNDWSILNSAYSIRIWLFLNSTKSHNQLPF